ncbi:uncharacterized protein N7498_006178 [Penicillium cinerascens]|uniref:Zn(2)-C6 fungal-type domain-containing protein n=1 Tax=Penicillium cinerascens TaxID=70096 RepID=A0A9W9SXB5_9EURO|nr:uncharacterized protein N7498_006178 [Penicillium cinerascens]KAJ5201515.1 hypothetical protein N7498_006178 [Penicillium cinerascens]
MQPSRKRKVSSCIPCYTRKQKCNRQYPCNHCTRRRRPEDCAYYPSEDTQPPSNPLLQTRNRHNEYDQRSSQNRNVSLFSFDTISELENMRSPTCSAMPSSLTDVFGYSEDSQSNTIALVRMVNQWDGEDQNRNRQAPLSQCDSEIHQCLDKIPDGPILDFLVKYFVSAVNWMDQLVHIPWILNEYQRWRIVEIPSSLFEVEFAVLILRICSYTTEYLPSPSCTIERIRDMSLADIRYSCDEAADSLAEICLRLNPKGSLLRVQHLAFVGLKAKCQGFMKDFQSALRSAIEVAQRIGADKDVSSDVPDMSELEKETRRRIFCNLYIWDSYLSRQLDRIPTIPSWIQPENMPRMRLGTDINDAHGLEEFTERILQVRLANFWRSMGPTLGSTYDIVVAQERYESLCGKFLTTLPSAFALQPNKQWDERLPMLAKQREVLFISIFESLCYNFRPAILLDASHLPKYKQVLLSSQRKALAGAALQVLQGVSRLHSLIGGTQTRYTGIIQPTFEAAVLLVSLCMDQSFPGDVENHSSRITKMDPLSAGMANLTWADCMDAIRDALKLLKMLAEVSNMADVGAQSLVKLIGKVAKQANGASQMENPSKPDDGAFSRTGGSSAEIDLPEYSESDPTVSLAELVSMAAFDVDMNMNWDALASNI